MVPEMNSSSFLRSARAARGRPQFATYDIKVCWVVVGSEWMNILVPKNGCLLDGSMKRDNLNLIYMLTEEVFTSCRRTQPGEKGRGHGVTLATGRG